MALLTINFASRALARQTDAMVLLPERDKQFDARCDTREPMRPYRALYLLHGLGGDRTSWLRNTTIENLVRNTDVAVVMPQVEHGFYTDMAHGPRYFSFVADELPNYLSSILPLSTRREDTMVCGASLGGYGAFKLALTYPERFCRAAALSGALDIQHFVATFKQEGFDPCLVFGNDLAVAGTTNDLFHLLDRNLAAGRELPLLYSFCGTNDILLEESRRFAHYAQNRGVGYKYVEGPGEHLWTAWAQALEPTFSWLIAR